MPTPVSVARARSLVSFRPLVSKDGGMRFILQIGLGGDARPVGEPLPLRAAAELAEHFDAAAKDAVRRWRDAQAAHSASMGGR